MEQDEAHVALALAALLAEHDPLTTDPLRFRAHQFDAGLAWVHLPGGCGELGVHPSLQRSVDRALGIGQRDTVDATSVLIALAAPTIAAHGTQDQRERFLRPLVTFGTLQAACSSVRR